MVLYFGATLRVTSVFFEISFFSGSKIRKVYLLSSWGSWASWAPSSSSVTTREQYVLRKCYSVHNCIFLSHMSLCAYCWVCKSCFGRRSHCYYFCWLDLGEGDIMLLFNSDNHRSQERSLRWLASMWLGRTGVRNEKFLCSPWLYRDVIWAFTSECAHAQAGWALH